jgi:hypothetical protein
MTKNKQTKNAKGNPLGKNERKLVSNYIPYEGITNTRAGGMA